MTTAPTYKYYLQRDNKFLTAVDTFSAKTMGDETAVQFDSEDAALDKAVALGIHLDKINVRKRKQREPRT